MARTIRIDVKPTVFKWLRTSAGWTIQDVSNKLRTSIETVIAIETGERSPTLRQVKELSRAFNRPMAAFLLSEPIPEKSMPQDYRMLPEKTNVFEKKTILIIRKARRLQSIGNELSKNISDSLEPPITHVEATARPELVAKKYREILNVTEARQKRCKSSYEFFHMLRDILEDLNILVFQFSMPVEDARAFVLADEYPYVIVVNTKDSIEARIFSLMHEFAHILLGETVIDLPNIMENSESNMETWCNKFASAFLLPENVAECLFKDNHNTLTDTKTLNSISRGYKISKAMILLKMRNMQYISEVEWKNVLQRYRHQPLEEITEDEKEKKTGGGPSAERRCISKVGNKFASIVAVNYENNFITFTDALNYLSIKSSIFENVIVKATK